MSGLIDDVLDLTRARLGGGLKLDRRADTPLGPVLKQVVDELRAAWPDRTINVDLDLPRPVNCDPARIAQLLSNLLANALKHGAVAPAYVRASGREGTFELSVANQGEAIPAAMIGRLFEPFYRSSPAPHREGLGLGLYIASEIARAHGGTLEATSTADETRFRFRMPMN